MSNTGYYNREVSVKIEEPAKLNYQQPDQEDVRSLSLAEVKELQQSGIFPSGSMGPKIEAVIAFLESFNDFFCFRHCFGRRTKDSIDNW